MKNFSVIIALIAAGAFLPALPGCNRTPAQPSPAAAKPTPEESFALIVETFRRGVEDVDVGFVVRDATGHSRMTGKNKVSHKLIPPTKPGEPYRATITVDSRSLFSIQRGTVPEQNEEQEEDATQEESSAAQDADDSAVEILNSDLVKTEPAKTEKSVDPAENVTVSRRPNEDVRNYELIYQEDRWFLAPTTKFDPETEQSIQNAFDRALATQV